MILHNEINKTTYHILFILKIKEKSFKYKSKNYFFSKYNYFPKK